MITRDTTLRLLSETLFGRPLVTNIHRGTLVEAMVAQALGPGWRWVSADWAPHDFEATTGLRLEVKQSAARQSWARPGARPSAASFDIARRKLTWTEPEGWVVGATRAEIYVFAHHPETDPDRADHRDPGQWRFYPLASDLLPPARRIALGRVRALVGGERGLRIAELGPAVAALQGRIATRPPAGA